MKKIFKLFLLLVVILTGGLVSCSFNRPQENNQISSIINKYVTNNTLAISSSFTVDNVLTLTKSSYYSYDNNQLKAYSLINTYSSKISNKNSQIEEFVSNSLVYYLENENGYLKEFNSNSILSYVGFNEIFNDAKYKKVENNMIVGEVDAGIASGIVKSIIYDCGYFNDNYANYYFNSKIKYTISLNLASNTISSIKLDVTDVAKLKNYSIVNASFDYYLFLQEDVQTMISSHPFPSISLEDSDNKAAVTKAQGIDYINDCYQDIKYVSDSLTFYPRTLVSTKLSFTYESNKPNVIGHDGTYYPVSSDQEVTITVHLFYAEQEYHTTSFTFLAIPKPTQGSGDLGSQSNYLYKGRKPINEVKINFIEMHKQYGDSIYIQAGDFDMLIDAGDSSDGGYVNDFLRRNVSDGRIEMIVATHAHSDHIGGMMTALATFPNITYAVDYGYSKTDYSLVTQVRNRFKQADNYHPITDCIDNKNGARSTIYITNDFYISFLDTGYYEEPNVDFAGQEYNANMTSVAMMITFKNQKYYFAGDLEAAGETNLVNKGLISKATVAKASHHGSTTSNRTNILSKLRADVTVISTALVERGSSSSPAQNQIHPIGNALEDMLSYSSKVYCNFTMGTVQVTCDGNSKKDVKGLGLTSPYYMNGKAVTGEENLEFKYTKWAKQYRSYYI